MEKMNFNYRPGLYYHNSQKFLRLFGIRLDSFINRYNCSNQYGRTNMSTSLVELTEEITTALDEKKVTAGVFIDLKKADD